MELPKGFEGGKGKDKLTLTVKLTETEYVTPFLKEYNSILEDERIDKHVRKEYYDRFEKLYDKIFNKQE